MNRLVSLLKGSAVQPPQPAVQPKQIVIPPIDSDVEIAWRKAWASLSTDARIQFFKDTKCISHTVGTRPNIQARQPVCGRCEKSMGRQEEYLLIYACGHWMHTECMEKHICAGNVNCGVCKKTFRITGRDLAGLDFTQYPPPWKDFFGLVQACKNEELRKVSNAEESKAMDEEIEKQWEMIDWSVEEGPLEVMTVPRC